MDASLVEWYHFNDKGHTEVANLLARRPDIGVGSVLASRGRGGGRAARRDRGRPRGGLGAFAGAARPRGDRGKRLATGSGILTTSLSQDAALLPEGVDPPALTIGLEHV